MENTFVYSYSAKENAEVSAIREKYQTKTVSALNELKELDRRVKRPADIFAYVFGSIAAIIMGAGMSLVMTDIAQTVGLHNPMLYGIIIGVIGMLMVIVNYPMYKSILSSRRRKYADKVIALSDKIIKG